MEQAEGCVAISRFAAFADESMRARICQIIEYEDGLIIRQRNYDCFEPF